MARSEFLRALERQMEVAEGALKEDQLLSQTEGWDSMASVLFIALADEKLGAIVSGNQIAQASTVGDLLNLVGDRFTP
ncbi:MAG TPA: acyl carrier protein [Bryobacteraceae bacterium]|nr:acyl carrier protein [Bryobacteraceae bacterium]